MERVYDSIVSGINEAIEDANNEKKLLTRRVVSVVPVKKYKPKEIIKIRKWVWKL